MERTRDEALRIGQEIAERVAGTARACRCGIAMWSAEVSLASLDAIVSVEQTDGIQIVPQFVDSAIAVAEKDCGVDMSQARGAREKLVENIKNREWEAARAGLARLKTAIIEPVRDGAIHPPEFLDVKDKKFKLVGEEPDEDKASIWASNMTEHGENIVVVPFLGKYSLYREE